MPTSAATAATVSGRSPESTFSSTPWRWKNSTAARASGRRRSPSTARPSAGTSCGPCSAEIPFGDVPSATTRRPAFASTSATAASGPSAKSSGAPRTTQRPSRRTAPNLRLEEKGTVAVAAVSGWAGKRSASASTVAFRTGASAAYSATHAASSSSATPCAVTTRRTSSRGSVSVPVLSRQTTSTDASDSTAFSCCTRAPRAVMRSAATA